MAFFTCRELTEVVTSYLERRMSLGERMRFRVHVGLCRHCWAYLDQMQKTVDALGRMPDEPIPEDVRATLLARFRDWNASGEAVD